MSLRTAEGNRLDWIDTRKESGFSNFLYVDQNYAAHPVMRRLFSLARKHGYQSVLVEELTSGSCCELQQDDEDLVKRQSDFVGSQVHRLSFLRSLPDQTPDPHDFVGSAIFKTDSFSGLPNPRRHVYEAIMPPTRGASENNFIHCIREYQFHTSVGDFRANGVLYAQQNDLTTVCAHVSLRTVLATLLPDGDISYARINQLAGIDHQANQVGNGRGLEPVQMEQVFSGLGIAYEKFVHEPGHSLHLPTDYQRHLYGCVESGMPALLGFELDDPAATPGTAGRHIIPVLGHTFNEDAWVPEAQRNYFAGNLSYYPSESWLSAFVAHDDNFGPYYCLPRNFLRKENFRLILAPKRTNVLFSALEAETLAFGYAQTLGNIFAARTGRDWLDRFSIFTRLGSLVIRTQGVTRDEYIAHLRTLKDWNNHQLENRLCDTLWQSLPEFFWMAELSAPELFTATRHKFGELLVAADRPSTPANLGLLLAARLPSYILHKSGGKLSGGSTNLVGHTSLFSRVLP